MGRMGSHILDGTISETEAYDTPSIASIIGSEIFGSGSIEINRILTDSRSLAFPEDTLFFALITRNGDGHDYIDDLYNRGVRAFVVTHIYDKRADLSDAVFLKVDDTLVALQKLAAYHRRRYNVPIIGITGSNGKTIVKEWAYQLISDTKRVTRSPRSYNSQIGVPLSVWMLNEQTEVGLFEAGISQPGEMHKLQEIISPTVGMITNIGTAHGENFDSLHAKCMEKLKLFVGSDVLIYCADDEIISACVADFLPNVSALAWSSKRNDVALYLSKVEQQNDFSTYIGYSFLGMNGECVIPFTDEASVQNAIHSLAIALYLRVPHQKIANRIRALEPVAMRLEVKRGVRGCTIINDSYNSDINSLDIALDFMNRRPRTMSMSSVLILSDIPGSGLSAENLYARVSKMIEQRGIDLLIGVGPELTRCASLFRNNASFFSSTAELLGSGVLSEFTNKLILIKGARRAEFENISEVLEEKRHETILEINLNAIKENFNYYRMHLRSGVKMVCMLKAAAYGAGAVEIAKTLQENHVDYMAVAVADEGVELRKADITGNIMVMNPEKSSFRTLFNYSLEPEVYSFALLEELIHVAESEGITNYPIHIKLDTGMHRLGFDPLQDMDKLVARLTSQVALTPRSVFSHFVGSDSPRFDDFSQKQYELFTIGADALCSAFKHRILRHICNSAGIIRFPERQLDMVRLGLGLYGIDPIDNRMLTNVTTLKTTLLQIHDVPAGNTIGYSRNTKLDRASRIATLPIGYADGLNRHLGNRHGYCIVNGKQAQYVGNICMDVCMIDVTDIECREGDKAIIFGEELPTSVLAQWLDTIPYEILTGISSRVKRIYYKE